MGVWGDGQMCLVTTVCSRARTTPRLGRSLALPFLRSSSCSSSSSSFDLRMPLRPYTDTPIRSSPSHASRGIPVATPFSSTLPVIKSR
jgi:hypothetical protein